MDTFKAKKKRQRQQYAERERAERIRSFRYVRLTTRVFDEFTIDNPPYKLCSRCAKLISSGFHYENSSIGEIWLCASCNHKVRHPNGNKPRILFTPMGNKR